MHTPILFNLYGNQLKKLSGKDLFKGSHYLARKIKTRTEHIVEIIIYNGSAWVPCAFLRCEYENDALYWVESINVNVDIEKMVNGFLNNNCNCNIDSSALQGIINALKFNGT